jgi:hypothetical protein
MLHLTSCLGPYTTQSETITITLRNSAGNPVVAAEPYTFYIALDVNQCNSAPFTDSYPMTIASGQSSVSYMNYTSRASDCGQGSCMEETSYFTGAVTTPTQLPGLTVCGAPAPEPAVVTKEYEMVFGRNN